MTVSELSTAGALIWAGFALSIDAAQRRRSRPILAGRLLLFHQLSVANEAQQWLRDQ